VLSAAWIGGNDWSAGSGRSIFPSGEFAADLALARIELGAVDLPWADAWLTPTEVTFCVLFQCGISVWLAR
jgi:hypothetical protein